MIDLRLLPGRVLMPTFMAFCRQCRETTHHAGLGGDRGEELGDYCLDCGNRRTVNKCPRRTPRPEQDVA